MKTLNYALKAAWGVIAVGIVGAMFWPVSVAARGEVLGRLFLAAIALAAATVVVTVLAAVARALRRVFVKRPDVEPIPYAGFDRHAA